MNNNFFIISAECFIKKVIFYESLSWFKLIWVSSKSVDIIFCVIFGY